MGEYYRNKGKVRIDTCEMCDEDTHREGEPVKAKLPYGRGAFYVAGDKLQEFERRTQDVSQRGRAGYYLKQFPKGTPLNELWAIYMLCQRCQDSNRDLEFSDKRKGTSAVPKHLRK